MKDALISIGLFSFLMAVFTLLLWLGGWNFERNIIVGLYYAGTGTISFCMTMAFLVNQGKV